MLGLVCAEVVMRSRDDEQAEETDQKRGRGVSAQTPAEIPRRRPVTRAAQLQNLLILILDHAFS